MFDPLDPLNGFEPVEVEPNTKVSWALEVYEDQLLVTTERGVYSLKNGAVSRVAFSELNKPGILLPSKHFPGRVYVGLETGLGVMTYSKGNWNWKKIGTASQRVTSMAEDSEGALWISTKAATIQVLRLDFNAEGTLVSEGLVADETQFDAERIVVDLLGEEVAISAIPVGVFRNMTSASGEITLRKDSTLYAANADTSSFLSIFSTDQNTYWTAYQNELIVTSVDNNGKEVRSSPAVLQLPDWTGINDVHVDEEGVTWIGHNNVLSRFDPQFGSLDVTPVSFEPMIRSVSIAWTDSILFSGITASKDRAEAERQPLQLHHSDNDLRFEFALPDFHRKENIEFQYLLKGYDKKWSTWTKENSIIYRNVDPGNYTFQLRSRTAGTPIKAQVHFPFRITPPWFASVWMQSIYISFALMIFALAIRHVHTRRRLTHLEQERVIFERINQVNEQLRSANSSLEEANKMKDEFLANASHELRTPLTAILGFTSVLKDELSDEHQEFAGLIDENGKRLLQTINSLLDLAKLRAGMVHLSMRPVEINEKGEQVVGMLRQLAKNRNIDLAIRKSEAPVQVMLDEHSFVRVLYNLIGNAIKFTPEGSVIVEVDPLPDVVNVHVHDTGIGIDQEFIPYLFDEFKQEPSVEMRSDGSGLGLAISAKLVHLMKGDIAVKSEKGKGSTFTVSFPVSNSTAGNGKSNGLGSSERSPYSTQG